MISSELPATEAIDAEPPGRWIAGLSAEMPLLQALELIFSQRYRGVLHYLPRAAERADENIEYVHKLRVACRRLAAVLDIFAEVSPETPRQVLLELVQKVRQACGPARDLDVQRTFMEELLKSTSLEDAAVVELLCEHVVVRRERAQQKVRRRLEKLEVRFREAGEELLASLRSAPGAAPHAEMSFGEAGCRILAQELAGLWDLAAGDLESTQTLHQVRIAGKHLRYAFEVFIPALHESFREDFYPQLEEIQDLLGEIHDAVEGGRVFRRTKKKWKAWRGTKKWERRGLSGFRWRELRSGLNVVLLAYAQQTDHARTEFLDLWPGFAGDSFRRPVTELLGTPAKPAAVGADPHTSQGEIHAHEHLLPH